MANIQLPKSFSEKIILNQELDGIVKLTAANFAEILKENSIYFFPEFTDHGIDHIQNVLLCSEKLIPQETFNIIKSDDIANYLLAVILHDIGMHLTLEGFEQLLSGKYDDVRINYFDKLTWNELWQDFFREAQKFSGRQLLSIFGNSNTIIRTPPFHDKGNLTENDRKLIGEFIRRNHPRLSHEIALKGFPGVQTIPFAENLPLPIKDLIGVIARSHGMDLRNAVDYISSKYSQSLMNPYNCHVVYLMALLRISDYIQIDKSRSSRYVLRTKRLMSPISNMEHQAHEAVDFIDFEYQDDPERIFINVSPKNSSMFLKLKKLLLNIQYELDISWAVLGEVYGHIKNKPNLKYRRIKSNLEDISFKSELEYVPDEFKFKANDEIIKLLIAPLYGDNPKYGIRELLQNAIDACNERQKLEANDQYNPHISVKILDESNPHFEISDNGIGMGASQIKEHFLSAGSSFRNSYEWESKFKSETGKVLVKRNGRFGIGALAAFLLGDSIEIETRKYDEQFGYSFKANLYTDQIDVIKNKNIQIGTKIKIPLKDGILQKLERGLQHDFNSNYIVSWAEWYSFQNPEINYFLFDSEIKSSKKFYPDLNSKITLNWGEIKPDGFERVLWTYKHKSQKRSLVCNGIPISDDKYFAGLRMNLGLIVSSPKLNVFDLNGLFTLSLNRNNLIGRVPFEKELKIDLYKDFIAKLLLVKDISKTSGKIITNSVNNVEYPGTFNQDGHDYGFEIAEYGHLSGRYVDQLLISKMGYIPNYSFFKKKLGKFKLALINFTSDIKSFELDLQNSFLRISNKKLNSIEDYKIALESSSYDNVEDKFIVLDSKMFVSKERYHFLYDKDKKRISEWLKNLSSVKSETDHFIELAIGKSINTSILTNKFVERYKGLGLNFAKETLIECRELGDNDFDELLEKYFGNDIIIPFDLEKRKEKYPLAFNELALYMKRYK